MDTKLKDDEFSLKVTDPTSEWHLPEDQSEFIRHSPFANVWLRAVSWVFLCAGLFAFTFVAKFVSADVSRFVAIGEALVLLVISESVLIFLYRKISTHVDVGTGYRRLRSKVPEDKQLPIRVDIYRYGSLTGRDEGFMWLQDGTWYFKGLQTTFRFNQQDVIPIEAWPRRIRPDPSRDKPPKTLPMKSKSGPLELVVQVIDPYEDFAKRKKAKQFYRELYNWLTERPHGIIESLLPPLTVHPSLRRSGLVMYEGVLAGLVLVGLNAAVLFRLPRQYPLSSNIGSFELLVAIVVGVLLFGAFRLAWLEYRDLAVRTRLLDQKLL